MAQSVSQHTVQHVQMTSTTTAQPVPQQTVQVVTAGRQETDSRRNNFDNYKSGQSTVVGAIQIAVALVCIILNSVGIQYQHRRAGQSYGMFYTSSENEVLYSGGGIWCSCFFLISGGLAIGAAKKKTSGLIIANLVMSIVSAIFAFILMIWSSIAVGTENNRDNYYYYSSTDYLDVGTYAMVVIMLILSFAAIITTIWSSALSCCVTCCQSQRSAVGPYRGVPYYGGYAYYGSPGMFNTGGMQMTPGGAYVGTQMAPGGAYIGTPAAPGIYAGTPVAPPGYYQQQPLPPAYGEAVSNQPPPPTTQAMYQQPPATSTGQSNEGQHHTK